MDYKSFINGMAMQSGQKPSSVESSAAELIGVITECLCNLDSVAIPAFGTFKPIKNDEYTAPDAEDRALVFYPPSVHLDFAPSSILKKRFKGVNRHE